MEWFNKKVNNRVFRVSIFLTVWLLIIAWSVGSFLLTPEGTTKNYIEIFIEHLAPDLTTALIVYLFLELNVNYLFGITKVVTRPAKGIVDSIRNKKITQKKFLLLDTFLKSYLTITEADIRSEIPLTKRHHKWKDAFLNSLYYAIVENDVNVRILLLHPNSNAAKQRFEDLSISKDIGKKMYNEKKRDVMDMHTGIMKLFHLYYIIDKTDKIRLKNLNVKIFESMPSVVMISNNTNTYVSFYAPKLPTDKIPNLLTNLESELGKYAEIHFEDLWSGDDRTKDFLSYVCAFMPEKFGDRLFYYTGDSYTELDSQLFFEPRFITTESDDKVFTYLRSNKVVQLKVNDKVGIYSIKEITETNNKDEWDYARIQFKERYVLDDINMMWKNLNRPAVFAVERIGSNLPVNVNNFNILKNIEQDNYVLVPSYAFTLDIDDDKVLSERLILHTYWDKLKEKNRIFKEQKEKSMQPLLTINNENQFREISTFYYNLSTNEIVFNKIEGKIPSSKSFIRKPNEVTFLEFPIISEEIMETSFMTSLIKHDLINMVSDGNRNGTKWIGWVHLIRTECSSGNNGVVVQKGIHQDERDFVAIHLANKFNCEGGVTGIYKSKEDTNPIEFILKKKYDSVYINDSKVYHYVSDIKLINEKDSLTGYRDILKIDFQQIRADEESWFDLKVQSLKK
ncbi:MAG: 2OG-Fe dioxygenase family protein [Bacteroidetes bacterium]|nr:2OG-Fe dioxygenase family protein [Bacteroidota bacterium]